ncbi:MAG: hypothetical protein LBM98_07105 [Oscillospiraceae bacterium]|nr:hypothetical protein [Oscillospiraceae bacterium]
MLRIASLPRLAMTGEGRSTVAAAGDHPGASRHPSQEGNLPVPSPQPSSNPSSLIFDI